MLPGTLVAGRNQVARDIDAQHVRSKSRLRQGRGPIATSEIKDLLPFRDAEAVDERLSALSHALRDACEIAFFPKCFVRIHCNTPFNSPVAAA